MYDPRTELGNDKMINREMRSKMYLIGTAAEECSYHAILFRSMKQMSMTLGRVRPVLTACTILNCSPQNSL